jgi:hypothetical protein
MKRLSFLALLLTALLTLAGAVSAQETRIAAVVNDDVISVADVGARMRLVFASSNIEDTPESRQRVARQVVRILIDEKLEMQEAKRLNLKVSEAEIAAALANIEAQNNLPKGGLDKMLSARGVERGTLVDQLTATLAWGKVVRQNLNRVTPAYDGRPATRAAFRDIPGGQQPPAGCRGSPLCRPALRAIARRRTLCRPGSAVLAIGHGGGWRRYRLGHALSAIE